MATNKQKIKLNNPVPSQFQEYCIILKYLHPLFLTIDLTGLSLDKATGPQDHRGPWIQYT